jgi:hypothetical protein
VTRMMKEEVKLKETPSVLQRGLCGPDIWLSQVRQVLFFPDFFFFFETGSPYIAQAGLKLTILLPLLSSAGMAGTCNHSWLFSDFWLKDFHTYPRRGQSTAPWASVTWSPAEAWCSQSTQAAQQSQPYRVQHRGHWPFFLIKKRQEGLLPRTLWKEHSPAHTLILDFFLPSKTGRWECWQSGSSGRMPA